MKTKSFTILIIAILTVFVTAQTSKKGRTRSTQLAPGYSSARLPGQLTGESDSLVVPASVKAGSKFEITIKTGGNGCSSMGDTGVVLGEQSADVFVYDLTSATQPGMMCTMIFKQFNHKARLKFSQPGEAVIRVWVREAGDSPMGKPVVVERKIIVK